MNAVTDMTSQARILNVSEDEYHADPCSEPSLSSSIAKVLVTKSPLHAWTAHPKLGNLPSENGDEAAADDSQAMKDGKVIHKLLLGKGVDFTVIKADNYRTKIAQMQRDEAISSGRVPMVERKFNEISDAAENIKSNLIRDFGIDLGAPGGESEVAIAWHENGAQGPVLCRCRMDRVHLNTGLILDVKSIRSADLETCGKHAVEHGHDIQNAAYASALAAFNPELAGRIEMLFLHIELKPPYAVTVGPLDGELRELGRQRWERAVYLWEDCLRQQRWPSYTDQITPIRAPGYAMTKWMERTQDW